MGTDGKAIFCLRFERLGLCIEDASTAAEDEGDDDE